MKYLKLFLYLIIILPIIFQSCKENDNTISVPIDLLGDTYDNIPVIVNTENSYTFTISANNLSYTSEENLVFTNDSLIVTITLANASSQNSFIKLFNSDNSELFTESLNENKVLVNTELKGQIPKSVQVELNDFSGQLTIVVATDQD